MSWIQTYTGRTVDVFAPQPEDIDLLDIAHALSHMCRYAGHCKTFYSVAQHSVYVAEIVKGLGAGPAIQRYALLHDASEAYLVDIPHPIKIHPRFAFYRETEASMMELILETLGVKAETVEEGAEVVKLADQMILATEAPLLMGDVSGWHLPAPAWAGEVKPVDQGAARQQFLELYEILRAAESP